MKKIPLTKDKMAIVDDEMRDLLGAYKWWTAFHAPSGIYYARGGPRIDGKCFPLHHYVIGFPLGGKFVDHINGNGLDNRRCNLRVVTRRENVGNSRARREGRTSSIYPGVSFQKATKRWRARKAVDGKCYFLGSFKSEIEAKEAYDFWF